MAYLLSKRSRKMQRSRSKARTYREGGKTTALTGGDATQQIGTLDPKLPVFTALTRGKSALRKHLVIVEI